jgi:hypothetical protein
MLQNIAILCREKNLKPKFLYFIYYLDRHVFHGPFLSKFAAQCWLDGYFLGSNRMTPEQQIKFQIIRRKQ